MHGGVWSALAASRLAVTAVLYRPGSPASGLQLAADPTSQAPGPASDVSRIALVTIAVVAVAAFTVLQVIARSRCAREGGPPGWQSGRALGEGRVGWWRHRYWNGLRPTGSPRSRGGSMPATRRSPLASRTIRAGRSGPPRSPRRTTQAPVPGITVRSP